MGRRRAASTCAASYAYSDSYYDAPLLDAVGHPIAVNADVRLVALARLQGLAAAPLRPARGRAQDRRARAAGVDPAAAAARSCWPTSASTSPASRRSPTTGPVIAVFNHRSYFDATVVGTVLGQTGRSFRFLGKKEVFDAPVIGFFSKMAGGIRVNRSSGSDEPLEHGHPGAAGRRGGRAGAGGDDPPRAGVLRPRAAGPLGRRPPRRRPPRAGHPGRAVGHGEGVAAQPPAAPLRPRRAPGDPRARRRPRRR